MCSDPSFQKIESWWLLWFNPHLPQEFFSALFMPMNTSPLFELVPAWLSSSLSGLMSLTFFHLNSNYSLIFFFFFSSDRVKVSSWYCFSLKLVSLIGTCWQPYLSRVLPIFPLIIMTTARPGVSMFNPSDLDKFRQKPFWKIKGCNSSDISNAMIRILNNALYIYY